MERLFFALALVSLPLLNGAPVFAHDHEHGPHKGELIELGDEEYHAELLHDKTSVTIYVLDSTAKKDVAIDVAAPVVINLKQNGKPAQFALKASPQPSDAKGKSSKFTSDSADLAKLINDHHADARLRIVIEGKTFNAKIEHHHH